MTRIRVQRKRRPITIEKASQIADLLAAEASLQEATYLGIAADAGCSNVTISNFLNGKTKSPHFRTVAGIAKALGYRLQLMKR